MVPGDKGLAMHYKDKITTSLLCWTISVIYLNKIKAEIAINYCVMSNLVWKH